MKPIQVCNHITEFTNGLYPSYNELLELIVSLCELVHQIMLHSVLYIYRLNIMTLLCFSYVDL